MYRADGPFDTSSPPRRSAQLEDEYNQQLETARVRLEGLVESLERKRSEKSDQLSQQRATHDRRGDRGF